MISLKRFLNVSAGETAVRQIVSLLLEKMREGAVKGEPGGYEAFCVEMGRIREGAGDDATPEELLLAAESAVQAMENHNRAVTVLLWKQGSELNSIVSIVAGAMQRIGGEKGTAAQRLQEIADQFERAGALDDLKVLKARLSECLHSFREEAARQLAESEATIQALQKELDGWRSGAVAKTGQELDAVTGLPRAPAGLHAMQEALNSGKSGYIVAIVVNRMQSVNARFGFQVGDWMLRKFKQNVERQLMRGDQLFRWDGPTIVLLLDRPEPIEQVRSQIRRILEQPLEESFDVEGRSVLIPISASWSTFSLLPPLCNTTKQIQAFTASQGYRE